MRPVPAPRVLLVRAGAVDDATARMHGDYPSWFRAALETAGVELEDVAPFRGDALPDGTAYAGILLTGSRSSVRDGESWMEETARWALAASSRTPVLGVCFGHQLLAHGLGGRVDEGPHGPELGTVEVALTGAGRRDPLFDGLPDVLRVQALHRDAVVRRPPGDVLTALAGNASTPLQAFAAGPRLRAVQFHPELTPAALAFLLEQRGWPVTHPIRPTPHGPRLLANWVRHYVEPGRA